MEKLRAGDHAKTLAAPVGKTDIYMAVPPLLQAGRLCRLLLAGALGHSTC